ncbi:MAG: Gldg family protein [Promethearchaeota archaeon]
MEEVKVHTICFDYSHNNKLVIEGPSYNDFVSFLFGSSYKIGQIKGGITLDKLKQYDVFIIGNPYQSFLEIEEINAIEQYVREGGGLFVISDEGGDYENETNLNELTEKFGFRFNIDKVFDSVMFMNQQDKPIISNFEPHYITKDIEQIVHSSGCSIDVDEIIEADKNIEIYILARTGLNAYCKFWNGEEYEEEDAPKRPVLVAVKYYKGRVVGYGSYSLFSSLSAFYGYNALDNSILIANILNWLAMAGKEEDSISSERKVLSIPINMSLYLWMEKLIQNKEWERTSDIINFSLKYFKDNYSTIMQKIKDKLEELRRRREQKRKEQLEKMKALEKSKAGEEGAELIEGEESILELAEEKVERTKEEAKTFSDLMAELSKFTEEEDEKK